MPLRRIASLLLLPLLSACATATGSLMERPAGRVILTGGPNQSMIYALDTGAGVVLIDLGWWGAEAELRTALLGMCREPADVTAVFITHAHRDHIAAWPAVAHATFYLGVPEIDEFFGEADYEGWVPRTADQLLPAPRPRRGEVEVVGIDTDTTIVIGSDTIRAFPAPGHTEGSVAYLARGVLFSGDAVSHSIFGGMRLARVGYSDDVVQARRSVERLFERMRPYDVEMICTAHARCQWYDEEIRRQTLHD